MRRTRSWISPEGPNAQPSVSFQADDDRGYGNGRGATPPLKDEHYESYGFVQVGEECDSGAYYLKRKSLHRVNRNLERQLRILQYEVQRLKTKISLVEVCLFANATLGAWKFWDVLFSFLQKRKGRLLTQVVVNRKTDSLNIVIIEGLFLAFRSSFPLLSAAIFLSRNGAWKRTLGAVQSLLWALYLAIFSNFHPWTNYFLMLSSLLYLTAAYNSPSSVPTLREFNQGHNTIEEGSD